MSIYSVYSVLITQLRLYGLMWMYALRSRTRTEHAHNPFVLMIATDAPINHIFSSNFKWKNAKRRALTNCYFGNWTWRQSGAFFCWHTATRWHVSRHTPFCVSFTPLRCLRLKRISIHLRASSRHVFFIETETATALLRLEFTSLMWKSQFEETNVCLLFCIQDRGHFLRFIIMFCENLSLLSPLSFSRMHSIR